MKVYNYCPNTFEYSGPSDAPSDPLEEGRFIIPANATTAPPPEPLSGHTTLFDGQNWSHQPLPPTAVPEPAPELTYQDRRRQGYPPIGDQLDALFHAGVFPAEMAAIIQAVKAKYPKA